MAIYLNGLGFIAPVAALQDDEATGSPAPDGQQLRCIEPNYGAYIDPRQSRRMSRIVKMGIAAGKQALQDAGTDLTAGINGVIAGTGWGCLEDTADFLQKLVTNQEDMLSPTAFIHSTHNTIAGQIAYHLKCRGYNSTYAHRNISFESALLDATLLLSEQAQGSTLLVGGIDELTSTSFALLSRINRFKAPTHDLYAADDSGAWAGEGATFFAVGNQPGPGCYAQLLGVRTVSFASAAEAAAAAQALLRAHGLARPDLLLAGYNGDASNDAQCRKFEAALGYDGPVRRFKHQSGEYPTASAFALGVAASVLKGSSADSDAPQTVLIYNRAQQDHQSVFLLSAC
ncbi:beta-ketoacyl synthase chain length factor [Hymenobacter saemangeumensis]|uniref:Beta-ketoacyl synthase chain length factor n=1 Tax=Hymenobacter saemangeumensis TaxID=1084522 RepID=A0ABP8ISY3_9BACT